jgi:hypothetical protein
VINEEEYKCLYKKQRKSEGFVGGSMEILELTVEARNGRQKYYRVTR